MPNKQNKFTTSRLQRFKYSIVSVTGVYICWLIVKKTEL